MNRIRLGDTWYDISDLAHFPLSRVHSDTYPDGHVWQIAFGPTLLELDPHQALLLKKVAEGIDDMFLNRVEPGSGDTNSD